jgi:hypothetical protein
MCHSLLDPFNMVDLAEFHSSPQSNPDADELAESENLISHPS